MSQGFGTPPPSAQSGGSVVNYVWDNGEAAYIELDEPVRMFTGPEPPEDHGFTMRDGDVWDPTGEEA